MKPSTNIRTPYTETAASPPRRTRITFMRMDVMRAAMFCKKLGQPQEMTCRIAFQENRGLQKRSTAFPRTNGMRATRVQRNMLLHEARAEAQSPQRNTPKNRSPSPTQSRDMRMLIPMLLRI